MYYAKRAHSTHLFKAHRIVQEFHFASMQPSKTGKKDRKCHNQGNKIEQENLDFSVQVAKKKKKKSYGDMSFKHLIPSSQ